MLHGRGVEPAGAPPPGLPVLRHVREAEAVELAGEQLGVDHVQHRDLRVAVLRQEHIAERAERRRLLAREEADLPGRLEPVEYDTARDLVPVAGLLEDVEVRVAPVYLWGHAVSLARQLVGRGG